MIIFTGSMESIISNMRGTPKRTPHVNTFNTLSRKPLPRANAGLPENAWVKCW